MPQQAERLKTERVGQALALAHRRLADAKLTDAERFLRLFARHVAPEEIAALAPEDLYGAAMSLLGFAADRPSGRAKVRVYNPQADADGWSCRHSVIEIVNDDMPFLVDSVTAELTRREIAVHLVIHPIVPVRRDGGQLVAIADGPGEGTASESMMHIEVAAIGDPSARRALEAAVAEVLAEVRQAVTDWRAMRARMAEARTELARAETGLPRERIEEAAAFLDWLAADHFTFLGARDYAFDGTDSTGASFAIAPGSGLGILAPEDTSMFDGLRHFAALPAEVRSFLLQPAALVISKASRRSRVHRAIPMDVIGVKRFGPDGAVTGLRLFAGLYTSSTYSASARTIPILRRKVDAILARAGFDPASHDGKALLHILETYPRDELLQIDDELLFQTARGILHLEERPRVALFLRRDPFERFVSCLVFAPRDRYDTELRHRFEAILAGAFAGEVVAFNTLLGDSPLARVHIVIATTPGAIPAYEADQIERLLVETGRSWRDRLKDALDARMGEAEAIERLRRYGDAFPAGYRERFTAAVAVLDLERIEEARIRGLALNVFRPVDAPEHELRMKIYHPGAPMPLSDVLPVLENLGFRVLNEEPDPIRPDDPGATVWIHDFGLAAPDGEAIDLAALRPLLEESFRAVWTEQVSNDGFNRLVRAARLAWPEVRILRTYARFLRQVGFPMSQAFVEDTLVAQPRLARLLVDLFVARFDPAGEAERAARMAAHGAEIEQALDEVQSLEEDRTLRAFLTLVRATLRTNQFLRDADGRPKPYLSIKLDSQAIDFLPLPRPDVEVFVHSPRTEGIHLRGGKVARGGIRWSDRREDFRTEILGLMKAQTVKNVVIVPVGSKGGFVVKKPPKTGGREAFQAEGVHCYRTLMQGLLDITDNLVDGKPVGPAGVVRHDGDDPYLVVAADKGTATFSDIANGVAQSYGFWLGDAFASGGSKGYDHKAMGITARGAWEAVKRHFRERGHDVQATPFTVIGVGDMSGDVFGNGMLQSEAIRLIGAFDHRHVFVDPDPDPARSHAERARLYALPRSSWADYDKALISTGGGVFERSAKSVTLTPEMKERFGLGRDRATPAELIQAMLRADVDLLWFGGIGTYLKASDETNADVGDKANDALRVNGVEVRARVVGEGANLGATQRGRIEYAWRGAGGAGGAINTDAIDNSAGVDTSDHEVNIKVLLDAVVAAGDLTGKQRDRLLVEMREEVAGLVLRNNYLQTLALSLEEADGPAALPALRRAMRAFEQHARLDRAVEFLPDDAGLHRRLQDGRGMSRPELAVLLAYAKIALYNALLPSPLPDDPALDDDLLGYFPSPIRERLADAARQHRLRREITATVATNALVNRAGIAFVTSIEDATGAAWPEIAGAWLAARDIFALDRFWSEVETLDGRVAASVQTRLFRRARAVVAAAMPHLLDAVHRAGAIGPVVARYAHGVDAIGRSLTTLMPASDHEVLTGDAQAFVADGVPDDLARRAASFDRLAAALAIVDQSEESSASLERVARLHFAIDARFRLDRLADAADALAAGNAWDRRAAAAARDDLARAQRALTAGVLAAGKANGTDAAEAMTAWVAARPRQVERIDRLINELDGQAQIDLAMLTVATRTLRAAVEG
ncbi:MAG: NAD-glutamate dehydrogenase [Alphaproteobacteria bacterium]